MRFRTMTAIAWVALAVSAAGAPDVRREPYGTTAAGEPVDAFVLTNARGASARILAYGGIVEDVGMPDRKGRLESVVLALPDLAAYEKRANFGAIIGRVANRITGGGFTLDGVRHALAGANADGAVSHGGPGGFSARVWTGTPFHDRRGSGVVLRYISADGENGYPGALAVSVTYTLGDDDSLRLDYRATTDKPTIVNLTNHAYFNLAGPASTSVADQTIQIFADRYTPFDARRVLTGAIVRVAGTALDLRAPTRIGDRIDLPELAAAKGFDHNFVLTKRRAGALAVAARAADPASGRTLTVETTEPGLQFFTAGSFNGTLIGKARPLGRAAGFALEAEHFPDTPNHPGFPSIVLRPGQIYVSTTIYRFGIAR